MCFFSHRLSSYLIEWENSAFNLVIWEWVIQNCKYKWNWMLKTIWTLALYSSVVAEVVDCTLFLFINNPTCTASERNTNYMQVHHILIQATINVIHCNFSVIFQPLQDYKIGGMFTVVVFMLLWQSMIRALWFIPLQALHPINVLGKICC